MSVLQSIPDDSEEATVTYFPTKREFQSLSWATAYHQLIRGLTQAMAPGKSLKSPSN